MLLFVVVGASITPTDFARYVAGLRGSCRLRAKVDHQNRPTAEGARHEGVSVGESSNSKVKVSV